MVPVPQFTRQEENDDQSCEDVPLHLRVACVYDDIKPLLLVAFILHYHWVESTI